MIENSAIIVNKIVSVRESTYIVPLAFTTLFISNKPYVYIRILNPTNKYKIFSPKLLINGSMATPNSKNKKANTNIKIDLKILFIFFTSMLVLTISSFFKLLF